MPTIKPAAEVSRIFSKGSRISNHYVTLIFTRRGSNSEHDPQGRVAFIAGKKSGNAVWRNSAKRRMREIYRQMDSVLSEYNVIFLAKPAIMDDSYSKVLMACEKTVNGLKKRNNRRIASRNEKAEKNTGIDGNRADNAL